MRRLRADHGSIAAGSVEFYSTGMLRFYLYAAVAPSRSAARAFDDGQARRAAAFAADVFPGVFEGRPAAADRDVTLFAVVGEGGAQERALYVHRRGLIELLWALSVEQPETGSDERMLDVQEIAGVVAHLASSVGRRPYAEVSRAGRGTRRFARVDWSFRVTPYVSTADGEHAWTGLRFEGTAPPRAQHQQPAGSATGYGAERLRNRRRRMTPDQVARVLLGDVLAANGYYEFQGAVEHAIERAAVLSELPAPRPVLAGAGTEPSEEQRRVLDAVYEHFREGGQRAVFSELDKQLDLEGIQLRPLAESMPAGLLLPSVAARGGFFREDDKLMVTREGLRYCDRGGEALDLLARSLAYLAKREKPFVPSAAQRELRVTSQEIGRELYLTRPQLEQVRHMLHEYEWQTRTSAWDDGAGLWDVVVATEHVRRFRGIRDGDQYLRAREGESFAHQFDVEEAVPRFTLICEPPSSLALESEPVVLRVENPGPSETFEATVVEITGAEQAPTPWNVRWRGSADQRQEILSGGHWVLEIARDDAVHGASENNRTPGFVFLRANDKEVFVAPSGLGTTGSRYGIPMRVKLRVTPRSQAQRSLENVVTLQITEEGRQVLWDRWRVAHD